MTATIHCTLLLLAALAAAARAAPPGRAPLYWSTYEYNIRTDRAMPEAVWAANVDWVEKNLKPYGYTLVAVDGWGDVVYDAHGYRTRLSREWAHDYAWWSRNLQARGMQLGIYDNPLWVSRAAAEAGVRIKNTDTPLRHLITENKIGWFDFIGVDRPGAEQYVKQGIQHYADMGIRFLRVDFLSWFETGRDRYLGDNLGPVNSRAEYETALRWMREACDANGVFLSLVMPHLFNEAELERQYGHMIRVGEDTGNGQWWKFSDNQRGRRHDSWSQYSNPFDGLTYWSHVAGRGRVFLDADFLRLNTFDTDDERKSAVSLCLVAGGAVAVADQFDTIGDSLWIYQNRELLALNEEGFVGHPLTNDPADEDSQTWTGRMSNGDWIVGLFNRENEPRIRQIDFAAFGAAGPQSVRDLWRHEDLGVRTGYSAEIPRHGCVILRLSPPPTQES